jgi:hypothetical protein
MISDLLTGTGLSIVYNYSEASLKLPSVSPAARGIVCTDPMSITTVISVRQGLNLGRG